MKASVAMITIPARMAMAVKLMNPGKGMNSRHTAKIRMRNNKSSTRSSTNAENDLDKGTSYSVFSSSGLTISILPGRKLAAATPARMELNENKVGIVTLEVLYTNIFQ